MAPPNYVVNLSTTEREALTQLVGLVRARRPQPNAGVSVAEDGRGLLGPGGGRGLDRRRSSMPSSTPMSSHSLATPAGGHTRWTLRLLADRVVELGLAEACS